MYDPLGTMNPMPMCRYTGRLPLPRQQSRSGFGPGSRHGKDPSAQLTVDHEYPASCITCEFQLLHHRVSRRFLFNLFRDEPLQEGIRRVVALLNSEIHQSVDKCGDLLLVAVRVLEHLQEVNPTRSEDHLWR